MAIKQYKSRKDVPIEYTFDLESLLQGKTYTELMNEYLEEIKKMIDHKDSKYDSPEAFLKAHEHSMKCSRIANRLFNFISNSISANVVDAEMNQLKAKLSYESYKIQLEIGSETNRFFKHIDKMREWAKRDDFVNLRKSINETIEQEKYKLPDIVEEYLIKFSDGDMSTQNIFSILTNSELDYGYAIDSKGKKTKITPANRISLMKSDDDNIRKTTAESWTDAYYRHRESLANMLSQHIKSITTDYKVRGYEGTIAGIIKDDHVDVRLLKMLYKQVTEHIHIFKKYRNNKAKFYKNIFGKQYTKYDTLREFVKIDNEYTIEQAQKEVIEAFKPFGEEYSSIIQKAFKERWIDYMPVDNKRSGAYSIGGTFGLEKIYILMNFDGDMRSVETLAHELGHSMHSYFSCKHQPQELASYPIFLAEIASIFNELMLFDYWLNNSKDDKMKFKIVDSMISGFIGTVNRQIEWSNYEFELYSAIEEGKPINTYDAITKIYAENAKKYALKEEKKSKPKDYISAVTVPHFYYNFYVYKYSIGQLVANIFFAKYKKEGPQFLQTYIEKFLSKGGSDWPLEILKESGIDLYNEETYILGYNYVEQLVEQYIQLGNKLFKKK